MAKPNFVETWTLLHILFVLFESRLTFEKHLSIYCIGYPSVSRGCLKFVRHSYDSSHADFEEIVHSNLIALLLIKHLFTHRGWYEVKGVY